MEASAKTIHDVKETLNEYFKLKLQYETQIMANKKKIDGFLSYEADISNFNLNKKFDSAISLFHVINYLTDNQSIINCFNLVNNHLNTNGIFLFDIWYSPAVYAQKPQTRIKRI